MATTPQSPVSGGGVLDLNSALNPADYGPQAGAISPAATSPGAVNSGLGTSTTPTDYESWVQSYDSPTAFAQSAIPDNELTPQGQPSAWGLANTQALNAQIFTGYANAQPMSTNQLAAAVADHYFVHPKRGQSMVSALAEAVYQNSPDSGVPMSTPAHPDAEPVGTPSPVNKLPKNATDAQAEKYLQRHFGLQGNFDLNDPGQRSQFWSQIASQANVGGNVNGPKQTMSVADALAGMSHMSQSDISNLQDQLIAAGYYPTDAVAKKAVYKTGQMDLATMSALGHLMTDVSWIDQNGGNFTWQDYLGQVAKNPVHTGAQVAAGKASLATGEQLRQPLQNAFELALGRAPTSAELASFTSAYNTARQNAADANASNGAGAMAGLNGAPQYADQYGVQMQIGAPSEGQAAYDYAQQSDPSGAFAHKFANAAGIFANIIAGAGGGGQTSADVAMLTRPNVSNAGGITTSSIG